MALSDMRQWDKYEHSMPEHLEQERVLRAIDQLFEESNLFPLTTGRFPDLLERSTAGVRESIQQALDPNRDKRIDHPGTIPAEPSMAQQILERRKLDLNRENFDGGIKGWFRRVILRRPPKQAEVMLPGTATDTERGVRAFNQREVLSATYFLDPERAERIIGEKIEAEKNEYPDEKDKEKRYITNMMDLLGKRLGVNVWKERQAYPGIRFAMAFIANLILHPPKDGFGAEDVKKFVEAALGGEVEYEKTVREAKQAESNYKLMENKINKAETHVNDLMKLAEELKIACQETSFKDRKTNLENEINLLKSGEKTIEVVSLKELGENLKKALEEASDNKGDPRVIEADRNLKEREKEMKELKADLVKASGTTKTDAENRLFILKHGRINVKKPGIGELRIKLEEALEKSKGKENPDVAKAREELAEREKEIKTKEEELKKLNSLQKSIEGKRALLEQFMNTFEKPEKPEDESKARKELLGFIEKTVMPTGDGEITNTMNKLIAYELSGKFETYASELRAKLKSELETKKAEKEKALKAAEEVKDVKLTPDELVYKLFWHYFTTKKEEGGFLDNNIPDHWISKDNVSFMNKLRDRALLATRFAISEAKDQAVFAQLYANRGLAQHELAQRSRWGRFMEWGRSSWAGNKIAMAFGRPEQVSFDNLLERMRTVEVARNGKTEKPFSKLELKSIVTRGDLRKAIGNKHLASEDLPLLASYLEMMLKESSKIEIRPADAEMVYRTIRNLRLVRQEILHKQFMEEVNRTSGSMPEKLKDLWKTKWAAEDALDAQMAEEARKREFVSYLEKQTFDKKKSALRKDIIEKLKSGEMNTDDATILLNKEGFKVGRLGGLGLWSSARVSGAKDVTVGAAKAVGGKVAEKLGVAGITAKKAAIAIPKWTIYKPAKFFTWNLPKGILWSSKIRGKEHDGVLKYVGKGLGQIFGDLGRTFKATAGIQKTA